MSSPAQVFVPLAAKPPANPAQQLDSPLCRLPAELREHIYAFVFTAGVAPEPIPEATPAGRPRYQQQQQQPVKLIIHTQLLRTCSLIYHEAYLLPIALNPLFAFCTGHQRPYSGILSQARLLRQLPAWQFAAISSLCVVTGQFALEASRDSERLPRQLKRSRDDLMALERHRGLWLAHGGLAPSTDQARPGAAAFLFDTFSAPPADGSLSVPHFHATPISHLIFQMDAKDWWTWAQPPSCGPDGLPLDIRDGLALDPYLGDGSAPRRPIPSQMMKAAAWRRKQLRQGSWPIMWSDRAWGRNVAKLPDLQRFTLKLQTFEARAAELSRVVECAKLWVFPINVQKDEFGRISASKILRWDGKVDEYVSHSQGTADESMYPSIGGASGNSRSLVTKTISFTDQVEMFMPPRSEGDAPNESNLPEDYKDLDLS